MIPYDIDPSLHDGEPAPEKLGDGFSPRPHEPQAEAIPPEHSGHAESQTEAVLGPKSPF
jgi:hypothetical protein